MASHSLPPNSFCFFHQFLLGGTFAAVTLVYAAVRTRKLIRLGWKGDVALRGKPTRSFVIRAMIAAFLDNDDIYYSVCKYQAECFLMLGGFQLRYELTFRYLFMWATILGLLDATRILLAFREVDRFEDFVPASPRVRVALREVNKQELEPSCTYEDLGRNLVIVTTIFIAQGILIPFTVRNELWDSLPHPYLNLGMRGNFETSRFLTGNMIYFCAGGRCCHKAAATLS
jgi:hypothetical protein